MARLVIVGVDGSTHSLAALQWAAVSLSTRCATVRVVCVWAPPPGRPSSRGRSPAAQPDSASAATQILSSALQDCVFDERQVEPYIANGPPGPILVEAAGDADLLAVGIGEVAPCARSMRDPAGRTARYVTRHAPCPTVVIEHPPAAANQPQYGQAGTDR